jgi:ribonuclease-3
MSRSRRQPKSPTGDLHLPGTAAEDKAERLAARLGIEFNDIALLRTALTHRSVVRDASATDPGLPPVDQRQSNERLEFLGDAILGYIAADALYRAFPDEPEGVLTARRVAFVRAEQLVRWAREIGLQEHLYLGQGERISGGARDRMLAGAFEALIGAIALDQGLEAATAFLRSYGIRDAPRILAELREANPKGTLQEILQERHRTAPVYTTVSAVGPAHDRRFTVHVAINDQVLAEGLGSSKREAETAAASAALAAIEASDAARGSGFAESSASGSSG